LFNLKKFLTSAYSLNIKEYTSLEYKKQTKKQRIHIEQVKSTCENSVFSEYNARRQKVSRWKTN